MGEDDGVMDDDQYGQRIPTASDVEAISALLVADKAPPGISLTHTERNQIHSVLELYLKQFLNV